jgi:hypothetical protein
MGLRKAESREAADLLEHPLRHLCRRATFPRPGDELLAVGEDRPLGALAAHRSSQSLGLPGGKACELHRHLDHLLLEDDRPQRVAQDGLQRRVLVGDPKRGVLA